MSTYIQKRLKGEWGICRIRGHGNILSVYDGISIGWSSRYEQPRWLSTNKNEGEQCGGSTVERFSEIRGEGGVVLRQEEKSEKENW